MYSTLIIVRPFTFALGDPQRWSALVFHRWARGATTILGVKIAVQGTLPIPPFLLVSNHLSYVDVLVFASQVKCVFVARGDVARWPVIGSLCRGVNTIFIDRQKRQDVATGERADRSGARRRSRRGSFC